MVKYFPNMVIARAAGAFLHAHGIPVQISEQLDALRGNRGRLDIAKGHVETAQQLLNEFERSPVSWSESLEDQARPDLSQLPAAYTPTCIHCHQYLPLDADVTKCPKCKAPVDIIERIITCFGPEALVDCYDESEEQVIPQDVVESSKVNCPGCGYSLAAHPGKGTCPECGRKYLKERIILGLD